MIDHYIFADRKIKFWRQKNEELVGSLKKGSLIQIEDLGLDKKNLELFKEAQQSSNEVVIGDIDQDGFLLSNFGSIQNIPTVSKNQFYERKRFHLQLVAVHGFIGIKKNYKGNKIAFVNEIQGLYRLGKAGCNVPVLMNVDFDKATKADIIRAVRIIQENDKYRPWTKSTYKIMLKRFYRWLKKGEDCYRCGMSKKDLCKKGHYVGCEAWGKSYGRHLFKIRKKN